jgi:hypothetical protein
MFPKGKAVAPTMIMERIYEQLVPLVSETLEAYTLRPQA